MSNNKPLAVRCLRAGEKADARMGGKRSRGPTALLMAARLGDRDIVQGLIKARAEVNHETPTGCTALGVATMQGHREIVSLLINAGADLDARFPDGSTALFVATQNGWLEIVRLLVDAGAQLDITTGNNLTAIFAASRAGRLDIVSVLWEAGADIKLKTAGGQTPLSVATQAIAALLQGPARSPAPRLLLTLHVSPPLPDGSVTVACTKMSGDELMALSTAADTTVSSLRGVIVRKIRSRFDVVLPCGRVLTNTDNGRPLAEFGSPSDDSALFRFDV